MQPVVNALHVHRINPIEIRRRNFVPPDRFPYRTALGVAYDSGHYGLRMGRGPLHLIEQGLVNLVEQNGHEVEVVAVRLDGFLTEVTSAPLLHRQVAEKVSAARSAGRLPVVLSGNCNAAAIGGLSGIGRAAVVISMCGNVPGPIGAILSSAAKLTDRGGFVRSMAAFGLPGAAPRPSPTPQCRQKCLELRLIAQQVEVGVLFNGGCILPIPFNRVAEPLQGRGLVLQERVTARDVVRGDAGLFGLWKNLGDPVELLDRLPELALLNQAHALEKWARGLHTYQALLSSLPLTSRRVQLDRLLVVRLRFVQLPLRLLQDGAVEDRAWEAWIEVNRFRAVLDRLVRFPLGLLDVTDVRESLSVFRVQADD